MPPIDQYSSDIAPTGDDFAKAAASGIGSMGYKTYGYSNDTPSGVPKDHHFIADTLDTIGQGFDGRRPSAADWADPNSSIPGWRTVDGGGDIQAGDVLATPKRISKDS